MSKITVISLGPGPREHLTLGALSALENVMLRHTSGKKGYPLIHWITFTKPATILKNWQKMQPGKC